MPCEKTSSGQKDKDTNLVSHLELTIKSEKETEMQLASTTGTSAPPKKLSTETNSDKSTPENQE